MGRVIGKQAELQRQFALLCAPLQQETTRKFQLKLTKKEMPSILEGFFF
jgi:hypothetical protein